MPRQGRNHGVPRSLIGDRDAMALLPRGYEPLPATASRAAGRRAGARPDRLAHEGGPFRSFSSADVARAASPSPGRRRRDHKAIASKLFLIKKTGDRHVSNIFTKLDVPRGRRRPPTAASTSSSESGDRVWGKLPKPPRAKRPGKKAA